MKNLITLILFLFLINIGLKSQDYALFLHGFQGSDESWAGSGTPNDWVTDGIIDDYVLLNYSIGDLKSPASQASLIQQIAIEMGQKDPTKTANWVLVGHSMGGLVARAGYHELVNNPATNDFNIKAVLTVGTPHQGARATHVSLGPKAGYINVQPVLDEFKGLLLAPIDDVHEIVEWVTNLNSPDALDSLKKAPDLLRRATNKLESLADTSVTHTIKNIIGLNGSLIQDLNSGQMDEPNHVRSIFGAEKRFIPVRAANEMIDPGNADELTTLDNFEKIRWFYRANANAWDFTAGWYDFWRKYGSARAARRKRDSWNSGRNALDNIDGYWGEMIDSYFVGWIDIYQFVPIECDDGGGSGPPPPGQIPEPGGGGVDCWELQLVPTLFSVPTKNDVIISPDYAIWSPGQYRNDRVVNWYYDDQPADGGYNHFELRRYKRAYTLPGVFQVGQYAPPMRDAALWLDNDVLN